MYVWRFEIQHVRFHLGFAHQWLISASNPSVKSTTASRASQLLENDVLMFVYKFLPQIEISLHAWTMTSANCIITSNDANECSYVCLGDSSKNWINMNIVNKVKGTDICIAPQCKKLTSQALRYGSHSFYAANMHTKWHHTYLYLASVRQTALPQIKMK